MSNQTMNKYVESSGKVSRRTFLKMSTAVAGTTAAFLGFELKNIHALDDPDPKPGDANVKVIRTACMMCNAGCGIQVKIDSDGIVQKIEGNPFCPHTNDYATAGAEAVITDIVDPDNNSGTPCVRGNAGIKTLYDPYRITTPLKRTGARGEGKWQAISWKQAFDEIINGGMLPEGSFKGLKAIRGVPDEKKRAAEKLTPNDTAFAEEAKAGEAANFGYKANQYVWIRGRDQISQITKRFNDSFGTVNHIEHSSLCNTNHALPNKVTFSGPTKAKYAYMRADLDHVEYLVIFGSNPLEANVGTNFWSRKLMERKAAGARLIVVDPFFTHTASKADQWVQIKPGTDLAMIMGIMRWIFDNNRHLSDYLTITNSQAADNAGYKNYTDATYLVITENGKGKEFLTAEKAGLDHGATILVADITKTSKSIAVESTASFPPKGFVKIGAEIIYYPEKNDMTNTLGSDTNACVRGSFNTSAAAATAGTAVVIPFTVMTSSGTPALYYEVDTAQLEYAGTINGHMVVTSFSLLKEQITGKTVAEWAALCEVGSATIETIADGLSRGDRKSCAEAYRGSWGHTNGFQTARALNILNTILGRVDRTGGYCTGPRFGGKDAPKAVSDNLTNGVRIDRAGAKYEGLRVTPTRQWYSTAAVVTQEVIPSMAEGYPYSCKALFMYCFNPAYTQPNSQSVREALTKKGDTGYVIPLVVVCSIFMDETAALSDYILPDSTYFERFSLPFTSYATLKTKAATIRRPVIGSYKNVTIEGRPARIYIPEGSSLNGTVFLNAAELVKSWTGPMPYDEQLVQLGKMLDLPNFGLDAMGSGKHLDTAYQLWNEVFALGDFKNGLGDEGATGKPGDSTESYMVMGGRWENPAQVTDPNNPHWVKNKYGDMINIFAEKIAHAKNYLTGEEYSGVPVWEEPNKGLKGTAVTDSDYNFTLGTYKRAWHTQSRSTSNEWMLELQTDGFIYLNAFDAEELGVRTGDEVIITSPNGRKTRGTVRVVKGIRQKSVFVDHHFGRSWFGSRPYRVDGKLSGFDTKIGTGPNTNLVMLGDPDFPDTCLTDPISGQAGFFSSTVKIQKA